MTRPVRALALVLLLGCSPEGTAPVGAPPEGRGEEGLAVDSPVAARPLRPALGDLAEMRERGVIRALVAASRTGFSIDRGRPRGFEVEMLQAYEDQLNAGLPREQRAVRVVYIPMRFEALLPALLEGRGDLVAAGMTVTPERRRRVAFSKPYLEDVNEIVVSHVDAPPLGSLGDLAGRVVHVPRATSFVRHLQAQSARLTAQGLEPIGIVEVDPRLQTEDVLELVHSGVFELTVADDHVASIWARALDRLVPRHDLVIHEGGSIAWAVRPESEELRASLDAFLTGHRKGTLLGNLLFRRYYDDTRWIHNPLRSEDRQRLDRYAALFRKYADRYGFDWLKIAAQAYQESGLRHDSISAAGAVGLMQVLPATAEDPRVGIPDVAHEESNVHAGVKYMAFLRDRYFSDPEISEAARFDLTLAAYNMGPRRLRELRRAAAARGLDPNRWFGSVELVALERVGQEPVRYVSNVNKYFVAYRWALQQRAEAAAGHEQVAGAGGG